LIAGKHSRDWNYEVNIVGEKIQQEQKNDRHLTCVSFYEQLKQIFLNHIIYQQKPAARVVVAERDGRFVSSCDTGTCR